MSFLSGIFNYWIFPTVLLIVSIIALTKYIDSNDAKNQKKRNEDLKQIFKEAIKEAIEETRQ